MPRLGDHPTSPAKRAKVIAAYRKLRGTRSTLAKGEMKELEKGFAVNKGTILRWVKEDEEASKPS
jgi:hypothetical protein